MARRSERTWWDKIWNAIKSGAKTVWEVALEEASRYLIEIILNSAISYFSGGYYLPGE
ncbi:MAG: hypothetical protein F6K47_31460 [Symploca sp. SIO2E6]|nr:hypothetical protein [Symploca sp. SIO2E6]